VWAMSGWGVAFFLFGMMATNAIIDHARQFDPLFCNLYYSSSTHKRERWVELPLSCYVEDRRPSVKGDKLTYHSTED
jgi:hypothetical protein